MFDYIQLFKDRHLFNQCTNEKELNELLNKKKITFYIGFDATADALHAGSLVQLRAIKTLIKHGHKAIVLLGGGTTKIGDPSGKDSARKILTYDEIQNNIDNFKRIFEHYFRDHKESITFINNDDWLSNLNYIELLRDVGSHLSINRMLTFESVKERLKREQSLSFLEFNYMVLQSYDFLHLNLHHQCDLQIGGSDQWGNIVNGVDLIKRHSSNETFGLTTPLITLASGTKMGKTESGAIWLDKKLLSTYDYWQFWRNVDDKDLTKFLKIFTEISLDEIEKRKNDNINDLKILLANHATSMLHGKEEAKKCYDQAKKIFSDKSSDDGLPKIKVKKNEMKNKNLSDLIISAKLETSKSEIKRLIKNNGIKVNNIKIEEDSPISQINLNEKNYLKLSIGKKKHFKIEFN